MKTAKPFAPFFGLLLAVLSARAQSFSNLNFESATLSPTPIPNIPPGAVAGFAQGQRDDHAAGILLAGPLVDAAGKDAERQAQPAQ